MNDILKIFKVLADPTRLRIMNMLSVKPLCVCEVMAVLKMAQSTTSRHLKLLSEAGLIEEIPGGIWTVYRLAKKPEHPAVKKILEVMAGAEKTPQIIKDMNEAKTIDRNRECNWKVFKRAKKRGDL